MQRLEHSHNRLHAPHAPHYGNFVCHFRLGAKSGFYLFIYTSIVPLQLSMQGRGPALDVNDLAAKHALSRQQAMGLAAESQWHLRPGPPGTCKKLTKYS